MRKLQDVVYKVEYVTYEEIAENIPLVGVPHTKFVVATSNIQMSEIAVAVEKALSFERHFDVVSIQNCGEIIAKI